tara:strand:+ start:352 stop:798 length:447 start_codon:yes stop_codon:yes gene_type:complete
MTKYEFIVGDQYIEDGHVGRIYTYVSESHTKSVGIFTNCSGTNYHLRYETMSLCKKPEPKYPNSPLQHCEERIAFAKGANIEASIANNGHWFFDADPEWQPHLRYRVKVEKTKDDLRIEELEENIRAHENCVKAYKKELAKLKPTVHY